jgi:hypothetical protein
VALASLLGWPFAAFAGLPIAIDAIYRKGMKYLVEWALIGGLAVLVRTF